jgi:hypothetical protein
VARGPEQRSGDPRDKGVALASVNEGKIFDVDDALGGHAAFFFSLSFEVLSRVGAAAA